MKKLSVKLIVLMLLFTVSIAFAGCASKADPNIIKLNVSDTAKEKAELLLSMKPDASTPEELYEQMKELYYTRSIQTFPSVETKNNVGMETCSGSDVYTLEGEEGYENIVLYIHGGAWTYEIDPLHVRFCDELVDRLNAKVYMPLYPLAPQYTFMETYQMVADLYNELLEQGKPIFVMGDSAGGNISLGVMYLIKKYESVMPQKLILLAPCADMTFTNEDMKAIEPVDPTLDIDGCLYCAEIWSDDRDLSDPLLSAVYADTTGYPDTMIFAGTHDILYPDNMILYENMKKAGNEVKIVVAEGLWHVFPLSSIPEQEDCFKLIEDFCKA